MSVLGALALVLIATLFEYAASTRGSAVFLASAAIAGVIGALATRRWAETASNADAASPTESCAGDAMEPGAPEDATPGERVRPVEYLTAFSHQLRTPLNSILGFCDVLLGEIDGEVSAEQSEDLQIIRGSGLRLRTLIDSALDFSLAVQDELPLEVQMVAMGPLLERAVHDVEQFRGGRGRVSLHVIDAPGTAAVDEARMTRSIVAVADYVQSHVPGNEIAIRVEQDDNVVSVEFAPQAEGTRLPRWEPSSLRDILRTENPKSIRRWPLAIAGHIVGLHGGDFVSHDRAVRLTIPASGGP